MVVLSLQFYGLIRSHKLEMGNARPLTQFYGRRRGRILYLQISCLWVGLSLSSLGEIGGRGTWKSSLALLPGRRSRVPAPIVPVP